MAVNLDSWANSLAVLSTTLNSFEAILTLVLILMSLFLRALIGKDATLLIWMNSFLQTPGDIAFAATSFLIAVLLKHGTTSEAVTIALVTYFVMLLLIYWIQHCAQRNLSSNKYWRMSGQQIAALVISLVMLMYAIVKLTASGTLG